MKVDTFWSLFFPGYRLSLRRLTQEPLEIAVLSSAPKHRGSAMIDPNVTRDRLDSRVRNAKKEPIHDSVYAESA